MPRILFPFLAAVAARTDRQKRRDAFKEEQRHWTPDPLGETLRREAANGGALASRGAPWPSRGALPRREGDLAHRWRRGQRSGSISRHAQHRFMWHVADTYGPKLPKPARCLDWEGSYIKTIFNATCAVKDYVVYAPAHLQAAAPSKDPALHTEYKCDAHAMASVVPHDAYDLVIANSVFEHLRQPFVAAKQIALVLRPGGYLLWHTPFMFPFHGVPNDYFRYTHAGAAAVAEDAGLVVETSEPDGGYASVLGHVTGFDTRYFSDAELDAVPLYRRKGRLPRHDDLAALHHKFAYHLSTKMVARKPEE